MKVQVISAMVISLLITGMTVGFLSYLRYQGVIILGGAGILAFIGWSLTTYQNPLESSNVINLYLLAVAIQTIHMGEEYLGRFGPSFSLAVNLV